MSYKKLIIICIAAAAAIIGSVSIATNNKSKLNYIEDQSKKREEAHQKEVDSLIKQVNLRDIRIINRDTVISRKNRVIIKMVMDFKSNDKEIRDSIRKTPIDQILKKLRE